VNKCHFVGKLTSEPEVEKEGGTPVIRFELEVEEFRKDKGGDKKRSVVYLDFEAWDSAATAIERYAQQDSIMVVEAIARVDNDVTDDDDCPYVYFRVTSFKIIT
tara:strand:+ start:511 stop:822 length:312 start_codon:yes stop_codon:yes gene_type:complete